MQYWVGTEGMEMEMEMEEIEIKNDGKTIKKQPSRALPVGLKNEPLTDEEQAAVCGSGGLAFPDVFKQGNLLVF